MLTAWSDRWYHYDLTGNITGELDASGLVQSHVWMEAFGTVVSGGQTGRRLTTKTYDPAAGLYDFSARWCNPTQCGFLQENPAHVSIEGRYTFVAECLGEPCFGGVCGGCDGSFAVACGAVAACGARLGGVCDR